MGGIFAVGAAAVTSVFVWQLVQRHEIRTALAFLALITGAAAVGLLRVRSWGRGIALFVALGYSGLATVALLAAIVSGRGGKIVPAVMLIASMVVGYLLGRPTFNA